MGTTEVASQLRAVQERLRRWCRHPVAFVRDVFYADPNPMQLEVLKAFTDPQAEVTP